jgi:hypothetical protein
VRNGRSVAVEGGIVCHDPPRFAGGLAGSLRTPVAACLLPGGTDPNLGTTNPNLAQKARIERLYAIADGEAQPREDEPQIVICVDEFGPLNLQPRPGRQWAAISGNARETGREPRPRLRATFNRTGGVRHLFAAYDLGHDKLHGHISPARPGRGF